MLYEIGFTSPIGPLLLTAEADGICGVSCGRASGGGPASPLLVEACRQLEEYFAGQRREFDLPLTPRGSAFQLRVWQALRSIHYGRTCSYRQLAEAVGCAKGWRAVGGAANRNPLLILVPCHRLLGADGSLTGFACGLEAKRFLLELEGASFKEQPGR